MDPRIWLFVLAANVATFALYGADKWKAGRGRRRIPEAWLLWAAFACGFAGAWAAMSVFRHKTRKTGFRLRLAAVSVVNPVWYLLYLQWTLPPAQ